MIDLSLSFASYFCGHVGNATQRYSSTQHIPSQAGVLGVLQVADAASYSVTVLHIGAFQLLIDMWLCQGKELNWRDGGGVAWWTLYSFITPRFKYPSKRPKVRH